MASSDPVTANAIAAERVVRWSPDCGDGSYRNPVLFADYSDPDVIRVGGDYWLTASSFNHVPGLPILHSRDLVNWTLVNYALLQLVPPGHFAVPRHGGGVWAPALRYHAGRYWIFYPDPDFGLYAVTAEHPAGRWSEPVLVKPGRGLIDPCPFWDDDGSGYLVHGWAMSRAGIRNRLTLHRLRSDNLAVIDPGEVIVDGDRLEGWHTLEGPKLYKRSGYYYIFAPAGGVRDGYQAVFRARSIHGPYEHRIVLAQGRTAVNGPHQGAWVDTPSGEHWFLHFQERSAFGRVVHLQPVLWRDDWPQVGRCEGSGPGEPVAQFLKPESPAPAAPAPAPANPARFGAPALPWQWQANPQQGWCVVDAEDRWRLPCVALPAGANLWQAGNLLLRKFTGPAFVASVGLALEPQADGDRAGLIIFGHDYAWSGLRREQGRVRLVFCVCTGAHQHGVEHTIEMVDGVPAAVELRVSVDAGARCQFEYRAGGAGFRSVGPAFQARSGNWVGAKIGVFAAREAAASTAASGHAVMSRFALETVAASE